MKKNFGAEVVKSGMYGKEIAKRRQTEEKRMRHKHAENYIKKQRDLRRIAGNVRSTGKKLARIRREFAKKSQSQRRKFAETLQENAESRKEIARTRKKLGKTQNENRNEIAENARNCKKIAKGSQKMH